MTVTLTAGTSYFLVTSPYYNATTGPYQDSITPANTAAAVIPAAVPEPGTLALLGIGLTGAGVWTRRRLRRG